MIDMGANNWNGGLANACYYNHADIVRLMIDRGANWCDCREPMQHHLGLARPIWTAMPMEKIDFLYWKFSNASHIATDIYRRCNYILGWHLLFCITWHRILCCGVFISTLHSRNGRWIASVFRMCYHWIWHISIGDNIDYDHNRINNMRCRCCCKEVV